MECINNTLTIEDPHYNRTCCCINNVSSDCMGNCKSGTAINNRPRNSCSQFNEIIKSCMIKNQEDDEKGN